MNKYWIIFLIFILSCTRQVNINFPAEQSKLVIDCIFEPDKNFTLFVYHTFPYGEQTNLIIDSATCKLYRNDTFIEILKYIGNGQYISQTKSQINNSYKIEVEKNNYETVYATSYIPEFPEIFQYDTLAGITFDPNNGLEEYYRNAKITIKDIPNQNNFYQLNIYQKTEDGINPLPNFKSDDPSIVSTGLLSYQPMILLFNDELFLNQETTIYFKHSYPFLDTVYLIIEKKSLTEDYYKYLKSVIIQANHQGYSDDIFSISEPIEVYTNIVNGFGIFSGINTKQDTLIINNLK